VINNMEKAQIEITLKNIADVFKSEDGHLKNGDIRQAAVTAAVDTGKMQMVITEELCKKLGLAVKEEEDIIIEDNGRQITCKKTEAIEVHWKNRSVVLTALTAPGIEKVLFGSFPLQSMRLTIDPATREVVGIHGDGDDLLVI